MYYKAHLWYILFDVVCRNFWTKISNFKMAVLCVCECLWEWVWVCESPFLMWYTTSISIFMQPVCVCEYLCVYRCGYGSVYAYMNVHIRVPMCMRMYGAMRTHISSTSCMTVSNHAHETPITKSYSKSALTSPLKRQKPMPEYFQVGSGESPNFSSSCRRSFCEGKMPLQGK